jgi:hypothetical protein
LAEGYIALYRVLLDKPIWKKSTPEQKTILITLLLMANYEENEWEWMGQKFKVFPGQFVTSLDSIVNACGKGITIQNVRTALERFEKLEFLTSGATKCGRLITILKWQTYQVEKKKTNKDSNIGLTKTSHRTNKDLTPNNKDNKDNKDNKNISNGFTPPTLEEIQAYCKERNNKVDAERWIDFYSSKGWMIGKNKMRDWKAAVRTWEKNDTPQSKQKPVSNFTGRQYDANALEAQLLARSKNDGL